MHGIELNTNLIKGSPERTKAKMISFELLNMIQSAESRSSDMRRRTKTTTAATSTHRGHFVSLACGHFSRRRTTSTPTLPSTTKNKIVAAKLGADTDTGGLVRGGPIALSGLCLVKNLRNNKLSFFFLFMLAQMVLVHNPVGFFGLSVFSKVRVKNKDFFAALLATIDHNRPRFSGLVPPCFAAAATATLKVAFRLDFSSLSCSCCVSFRWPVEEMSTQSISCNSYIPNKRKK